jgi:hypothetical protein
MLQANGIGVSFSRRSNYAYPSLMGIISAMIAHAPQNSCKFNTKNAINKKYFY